MNLGKNLLKKIIVAIIRFEAKLVLRKYKPKIVGITGSVGKTGTKEAVARVLGRKFKVRKSQKSFNHDLGIPLTILGCNNAWWNPLAWLKNILEGASLILFHAPYPEWLVLEVGVEQPGDIDWVTAWIRFDVVVMTRLPEIPVHVEYFRTPEQLIKEKLKLPQSVSTEGIIVLNHDDPKIMAAKDSFKGRILTYGWREGATVRASNEHLLYHELTGRKLPDGVAFKIDYNGNNVPFRLRNILAFHQIYGVLAAIAVGTALEINLVDMVDALENLEPSPGRFHLLAGIKDTVIIDDTYNASPVAVESALNTLSQIETGGRKIAVLGDMMELGPLAIEAHRQVGVLAAPAADIIFTVGLRMKFAEEELNQKHFAKTKMFHFDNWRGVGEKLQQILKTGDVVLVKGSQSMRLEKVVEEVMAFPEDKASLLVRQEPEWQKR
jgi:UDP-N-acetylmuramoyl-tripeptide--D-alanyl-D-alanine ligase